jgi:surfeit locus 1 family protein
VLPMPRSLLWPTLWSAFGFILLLGLGTWQVERLQWKLGLIAVRDAGIHATPTALPATLDGARSLEFHPVRAAGRFVNERELYLVAPSLRGDAGYHVITPLLLESGGILLVDRGFVPTDREAPATREAGELQGTISVTGLLRLPTEGKPSWFTPANDPARNLWFYWDLGAMASAEQLDRVLPFYIEADASPNPGGLPEGGQTVTELPNNHLQYAITWYALAVALVAIYIRFARRRWAESRGERA